MSAKKVPISGKPTKSAAPANAEEWVANKHTAGASQAAGTPAGKMKRLTFDVSEELHKQIKTQCAMRGTKISDEVRELLTQKYGKH